MASSINPVAAIWLSAVTTRRENVYRHEWQLGDLVMWDNCGVMHRAIPYAEDRALVLRFAGPLADHGCKLQHRAVAADHLDAGSRD